MRDSHLHLLQALEKAPGSAVFFEKAEDYSALCSCRNIGEVEFVEAFREAHPEAAEKLKISFGIHPQDPQKEELGTLLRLIDERRIDAVGEIGLDLFSDKFKATFDLQSELFKRQLEIAAEHGLPVVLHIRKAVQPLFSLEYLLKKTTSVIFHSYSGTFEEAATFLRHGVNGFFSFDNALLNGHKRAIDCVRNLPEERILTETDAPYQPKTGDEFSRPEDLSGVIDAIMEIRR
ncbi:TatD family hydrolase [bacterium]|nr:TatD family hydrolase [bacterium]